MIESHLPQVDGVTNFVVRTTAELRRLGHHVIIVAPGKAERPQGEEETIVRTGANGSQVLVRPSARRFRGVV